MESAAAMKAELQALTRQIASKRLATQDRAG